MGGFWAIYNAANQLVSAQSGEDTAQFVYDGLGRCLKRTVSWETTLIAYDGWKPIVEWNVWEGQAYFKAWNVYGPGADEILWRYADSSGHLRYHSDRHGNIIALLDGAGNGIEKYSYDVFGKPTVTDWSGGDVRYGSWYWNRFLFQGREYFPELGLYDYRNRFYHPILGRFLQTDPTGFDAGDMNLFRYCGDDPVDGSDPTGLVDNSGTKEHSTLTSFGGGDWVSGMDGMSYNDKRDHFPAGNITMAIESRVEGPKSENDVTINQLRKQLVATKDTTSQIVPTKNGPQVVNTSSQVKVPKGGRSSPTFGYEAIGEERMNLRSDATKLIHAHTDEGKKAAVPTGHDFKAARQAGPKRELYFTSRYLARHGADPAGRTGNYIILRSTGSHHLDRPSQEYRFDPRLSLPPLP